MKVEPKESAGQNMPTMEHKKAIERTIGLPGALSMIVGVMIGSGIFASPKTVFENAGSVGMGLVVWAVCGLLATFGALCYAELGTMIPESGGERAYLTKIFGAPIGFLFSWTSVLILMPASISGISLAFAQYMLEPFIPGEASDPKWVWANKLIAFSSILVLFILNSLSSKLGNRIQIVFTLAKVFALGMLIVTGLYRIAADETDGAFTDSFNGTTPGNLGSAFYGGLWAFDGWHNLNFMTEELKNPMRDLPLSILIGIPLVSVLYILTSIAYIAVLPFQEVIRNTAVAVKLARDMYKGAWFIIPILVACSTFGSANGTIFGASRVVYTTAREGQMPRIFGTIQRKRKTPIPAMWFECSIACLMLIPDSTSFETIIHYFSFAAWVFYGLAIIALLWARYKYPDWKRPFKINILVPVFVLLCSLYLIVAPFMEKPLESAICCVFILLGLPVYWCFIHKNVLPSVVLNQIDLFQSFMERHCGLVVSLEDEDEETKHNVELTEKPNEETSNCIKKNGSDSDSELGTVADVKIEARIESQSNGKKATTDVDGEIDEKIEMEYSTKMGEQKKEEPKIDSIEVVGNEEKPSTTNNNDVVVVEDVD